MKRIPTRFSLGSYTIEVVTLSAAEMLRKCGDVYGQFDPGNLTIYLCAPDRETKRSVIYQTFWHEYAHAMLWVADTKRYTDEKLVDQLGHLLAQLQTTARFD